MAGLFGTDGVRGRANEEPMTAATALKIAMAAGRRFTGDGDRRHVAVIGKDTRISGYMLEHALVAGLVSVGMDVFLTGPMPTPAVAMLVRSMRADLGVMISASHNPYFDNGVKLFGPDGFKMSDADEAAIADAVLHDAPVALAPVDRLGRVKRLDGADGRYIEFVKMTFPRDLRLDGLKIVVDCANGAAHRVAPTVFRELGAEVIPIAVNPDGFNINRACGATAIGALSTAVVTHGADVGLALDGDADRLIVVDECGLTVDGDQIMGLIAADWAASGRLKGGALVATVMSNMGLERRLAELDLKLIRAKVGDRHVLEAMRDGGCNVGGEQSGHIIFTDYATTGDGVIAGLQFLACLKRSDRPASEVARVFEPWPQILRGVRYAKGAPDPLAAPAVQAVIAAAEQKLGGDGRVLVRKSGTEPVVRVMAEGLDAALVSDLVNEMCDAIDQAAGSGA